MPHRLYEHRVTHHLERWLAAHHLSRRDLAARMRFTTVYIQKVMVGERSVTDGFVGRFARTFGWQAAADAFGDIDRSAATVPEEQRCIQQ
jgi:hypothetical protein